MKLRIKSQVTMLLSGAAAFALTEIIAAASLPRAKNILAVAETTPKEILATWLAFLLVFFALLFLFNYFREKNLFGFFFYLSLFFGVNFLLSLYLPWIVSLLVALALFLGKALGRFVITQNMALIPAMSGIGLAVGLALTPNGAMILLLALSFYDIIAVYFTKHMVSMFRGMLSAGVIPAIIIPERVSGLFRRTYEVAPGAGYMLLGTGDIIVPVVFLAAVSGGGYGAVISSAMGSLAGFAATETIFTHQRFRRPMPALPPIASGTILGFLIYKLFLGL